MIEPLGGLGNQIFTYAVGLANATRLGTDLMVDLRNFENYEWHDYELGSFTNSVKGEISGNFESSTFAAGLARVFNPDAKKMKDFGPGSFIAREEKNLFSQRFLEVPDGTRLRGYFQSWKYVEPVASTLDQQLWATTNPSQWFLEKKEELQNREPWIGVHVRLGNYQSLEQMGVVADIYYRRGLELLRDLGVNREILIFTDSPEVITQRNFLPAGVSAELFESDPMSTPLENMLLLSLSQHLLMANSTFSWWAAWLGRNNGSNRRVIFPRPWINWESWDDRDLHRPDWIGLSREVAESERG